MPVILFSITTKLLQVAENSDKVVLDAVENLKIFGIELKTTKAATGQFCSCTVSGDHMPNFLTYKVSLSIKTYEKYSKCKILWNNKRRKMTGNITKTTEEQGKGKTGVYI